MQNENESESEKSNDEPRWKPYVGKEVKFRFTASEVFGVLNEPNIKNGYADFLPHWSIAADGEKIRIEKEMPLRVSLSILETCEVIIIPYPTGYMAGQEKLINASLGKKRPAIGFVK